MIRPARLVFSFLLLAAAPRSAHAHADLVAAFDDDANDATGPGSYRKPGDSEIVDGDFDLRRFEVWTDGDDVLFKVTLGALFREPGVAARTTDTPVQLWNNIYLQNIDIYIDTDRTAPGYTACIPGRRVAFAGGRGWKVAVVLTPQPGLARAVTEDALGEAGKHVFFPQNLQAHGRTVTARVPASALGGRPDRKWGYSVQVSGARWDRSFGVVDRVVKGKPTPDALTMPVVPIREAWAFGGAPEGSVHPRVIDVLLPRGANQKAILGSFDVDSGTFARVPFVDLEPAGPSRDGGVAATPFAPPPPSGLAIVDLDGATVTVGGQVAGIEPMMIGQVLDEKGDALARIVVERIFEGGFVATVLDGGDRISRGAAVRVSARKR